MKILGKEYRQDVVNLNLWHRQEKHIIKTIDMNSLTITITGFKDEKSAHNYLMKQTRKRNYETNNVHKRIIDAKIEIKLYK